MLITEGTIVLESKKDIEDALVEYKCSDYDDLINKLWFEYGITVIDESEESEYTQVNAQNSPLFYDEQLTESDIEVLYKKYNYD